MKPPYGEEGVRKQFAKIQKIIDEYHDGDSGALDNAKSHARRLIMEAANRK